MSLLFSADVVIDGVIRSFQSSTIKDRIYRLFLRYYEMKDTSVPVDDIKDEILEAFRLTWPDNNNLICQVQQVLGITGNER